jgi:hypothetical protein
VEGAVIVGSILLAFGIDAWWGERQDRAMEQEILTGLHGEFVRIAEGLERAGARWDSIAAGIGWALAAAESGRELALEEARISVRAVTYPYTFDPGSGVRDALIASGRLELIRDTQLRNQLVAWDGVLREVQDNEIAGRAFILDHVIPYLAEHGALVGGSNFQVPWKGVSEREELAAYNAIVRDPEFFGLASTRYSYITVSVIEYGAATAFVADLLDLVEGQRRE